MWKHTRRASPRAAQLASVAQRNAGGCAQTPVNGLACSGKGVCVETLLFMRNDEAPAVLSMYSENNMCPDSAYGASLFQDVPAHELRNMRG